MVQPGGPGPGFRRGFGWGGTPPAWQFPNQRQNWGPRAFGPQLGYGGPRFAPQLRGPRFGAPGGRGALLDPGSLQRAGKLRGLAKRQLLLSPGGADLGKKLQLSDPKALFLRLDKDGDGSISKKEFARAFDKGKAQKGEQRAKEKGAKKQKGEKKEEREKKNKEKD